MQSNVLHERQISWFRTFTSRARLTTDEVEIADRNNILAKAGAAKKTSMGMAATK